ncbi:unnamed protein product, partial [Alternaria alternata]
YLGTPGRYVVANQDFASSGGDGRVGLGEIHQEPFIGYMQNILEPQKQEDVGWQQKTQKTRTHEKFNRSQCGSLIVRKLKMGPLFQFQRKTQVPD